MAPLWLPARRDNLDGGILAFYSTCTLQPRKRLVRVLVRVLVALLVRIKSLGRQQDFVPCEGGEQQAWGLYFLYC